MEGKTYSRRDNSRLGQMSRTERDLSNYSQDLESNPAKGLSVMIRKILPGCRVGSMPHVGVVGAGMAGLRCAEVLIKKGVKVTILEGRDRIGGRVHQNSQQGHILDMGPNWIHGTEKNPFIDLAKETGTVAFSIEERSSVFDELGHPMNEENSKAYSELLWGIISSAFKYSNDHSASISPEKSLKDFVTEQVKEEDLTEEERRLILQMADMWGAFVGDPIERQSLKYFWLEECIDGENLFVASTYKAILERVAKIPLAKADVHLSTKVTSIESISDPGRGPRVVVRTANDSLHEFDEVVLTPPLGWLKRNRSAFSPPLPHRISTAISNISYGRLEKVFITFRSAFWDGSVDSSRQANTPKYPFFTHFLHPTYASQNPHSWNIELVSLSAMPAPTAHPTLLFYIHGPCATHVTSMISGIPSHDPTYFSLLDGFFKPYYSRLPHFSPSEPACVPSGILATDWQNDELAGYGSYTNFQTSERVDVGDEEVQLDKDIEALRDGVPERGVWFAGEHTAPFVALGTVTGAWWSGEAVGRRVAAMYGLGGESLESRNGERGAAGVDMNASGTLDGEKVRDGGSLNGVAL
ncbi:hypothetical protein MMC06_005877 [Schaereria dolodes]|nr:hypothetical protein [Schaereria dolodes]